ncbi:MAG: hypothetical protein ACREBU_10555 [Nitrososphaera sp.]
MSQLLQPGSRDETTQVVECPCLDCKHEFLKECVKLKCQCCALEDCYFMLTGDEVRDM